ncbi:ATP-binding cassette ATPase Uup [Algicola sagamiensis]|uniref:ATP-binding cassette ATPase Uup n=1 Tax=Algicola sagamiensis TaxID=163869 RepID=UPI00037FFBFB|nr:ABC transporter ATP-binding protein [Algicola sagamiensis]
MELLRITQAELSYGTTPLLADVTLQINQGERLCIVGRNGAGKSSLLKVIQGEITLDDGKIKRLQGLRVSRLEQDPPKHISGTVYDYVIQGAPEVSSLLKNYHELSHREGLAEDEKALKQLEQLQNQIEQLDGWRLDAQLNSILSKLSLHPEMQLESLSGGWLRKVALARALVNTPDILLLDEPTNHLDVQTVEWLEDFVKNLNCAVVFISHDRAFIRAVATRILDLDRGILTSFSGNYEQYLVKKEELLNIEKEQNALFDKKLAEEETWIRQGIKARRTRNEGRVRALKELRKQRGNRIERQGHVDFSIEEASRSGKLVFESKQVQFGFESKPIIDGLDLLVMRGDRIGLVGPNGIGKSTLLKLLLGDLKPKSGKLRQGVNLEVAYFDQYRNKLNEEASVQDNVAEGKQEIDFGGRQRHVLGYLQDFLFTPERARTPVKALSGGEKNRLLLAKLFSKPSNLLILDEPTNDLDVETLELLEDILASYQGTVLIVSHDREFISNTVTSCLLFEGQGKIAELVGGYESCAAHLERMANQVAAQKPKVEKKPEPTEKKERKKAASKLSYKHKLELEELPGKIDALEQQIESLQLIVNDGEFFKKSVEETQPVLDELQTAEAALEVAFERWDELESMQGSSD